VHRKGIERYVIILFDHIWPRAPTAPGPGSHTISLHATSEPFFSQLTKAKPTADPYPPPGSGKDKISYTEALGLVMIDYGGELRDAYGMSTVS
jgi:hypothetical protein